MQNYQNIFSGIILTFSIRAFLSAALEKSPAFLYTYSIICTPAAGAPRPQKMPGCGKDPMRQKIRTLLRAIPVNVKELLFFSVLYRAFGIFIFLHLAGWGINICLRFQRYRYVTIENLPQFLLSPVTLLFLTVFMILLFLFVYFEAGVVLCGMQGAAAGAPQSFIQMVIAGSRRAAQVLSLRHLRAALPHFAFFFISNIFFIYQFFYRVNPFCTYLPLLFNYTAGRIATAVFLPVCAVYAFFNLFTVYYLMYTASPLTSGRRLRRTDHSRKKDAARRMDRQHETGSAHAGRPSGRLHAAPTPEYTEFGRQSRRIFLAHPFRILAAVLAVCLLTVGIWYLLRFLLSLITALLVAAFAPRDIQVALTLTLNQYVTLLTLGLSATVGYILHGHILTYFFYRYSGYVPANHTRMYRSLAPKKRLTLFPVLILAAAVAAGIYTYIGIYRGTIRAERAISPISIVAHRGFSSKAPENTVPAISLAADYMADYAEIDVQCTTDGEVVLFHDRNLSRIGHDRRRLQDLSYVELSAVDIGSFFSLEYEGLRINTLREALEAARGRIMLIVELKRNSVSADLVPKVLALIEEYEMEDQCIIQSSDAAYLREVKTLMPDMVTGLILTSAIGNYYTKSEFVDFFCIRSAFVTQTSVRRIQATGKQVFAWTVNTRAEMERMKRLQVDAIITDYPILAREVLYREDESEFLLFVSEQLQRAAAEQARADRRQEEEYIPPTTDPYEWETQSPAYPESPETEEYPTLHLMPDSEDWLLPDWPSAPSL